MSRRGKLISKHRVKIAGLLIIITIASALLISTNYASLKITSAVRSYINGESEYSKGQKDASTNLILYLSTSDVQYWNEFRKELDVPIGDSLARVELLKEGSSEIAKKGFLQGRNKGEDIDEMIWLFYRFKNVSFMREAILIWKEGDKVVGELAQVGEEIHHKITSGSMTPADKGNLVNQINIRIDRLTILEHSFSDSLGTAARRINTYLFYANLIMTIMIIGTISAYILFMTKKLRTTNRDLVIINQELDKFVYSASHDLRAPISSMKGLVALLAAEKDPQERKHYLKLMNFTLDKQDQFIREIIDFSRNKKTQVEKIPVNLASLVSQVILQHQHMPNACSIVIEKEIQLDTITSDPLRLEIIFKNIISNAIKYLDPAKTEKFISIKTSRAGSQGIIIIEDNGIGIDENHLPHIFDMFFVTDHNQNGSGLGLYLTKETVGKLSGTIEVESVKGKGSKFTISLPVNV